MLTAFRPEKTDFNADILISIHEEKNAQDNSGSEDTNPSLFEQIKSNSVLRAVFFADIPTLWQEIEKVLVQNSNKARELAETCQLLCLQQKNNYLSELMALLASDSPLELKEQVILLLLACIVHNTPVLLAKLLGNIPAAEFFPQQIEQLYRTVVHFQRKECLRELNAARLELPPILIAIAYQTHSPLLAELWALLTPDNKTRALAGLLQVLAPDFNLNTSALPSTIKTFYADLETDFSEDPLPVLPILHCLKPANLASLNKRAQTGGYADIFLQLENFATNNANKPLEFFYQKFKDYLFTTTSPQIEDIIDIVRFYQSIYAHPLALSQKFTQSNEFYTKSNYLLFSRSLCQNEFSIYPLPMLWLTQLLLDHEKMSLAHYRLLHLFSSRQEGFSQEICDGELLFSGEAQQISYYLQPLIPEPTLAIAQLDISLKQYSNATQMPLPLPLELQQLIVSYLDSPQVSALETIYPSLKMLALLERQAAILRKQLIQINYLQDELTALVTVSQCERWLLISKNIFYALCIGTVLTVSFYYFVMAWIIKTDRNTQAYAVHSTILDNCTAYKFSMHDDECVSPVAIKQTPDCETLCNEYNWLNSAPTDLFLQFYLSGMAIAISLLSTCFFIFQPNRPAPDILLPGHSNQKIDTLFQTLGEPAPVDRNKSNIPSIISTLHHHAINITARIQSFTQEKPSAQQEISWGNGSSIRVLEDHKHSDNTLHKKPVKKYKQHIKDDELRIEMSSPLLRRTS